MRSEDQCSLGEIHRGAFKMAKSLPSEVGIQDGQKPYFRGGHSRCPKALLHKWAFKIAKGATAEWALKMS